MGLINKFEDKFGTTHEKAYFMIDSYRFNKDTEDFNFNVQIYHSKEAKENKKEFIEMKGYDIRNTASDYLGGYNKLIEALDIKGTKIREYLYSRLKELPEFKGSRDD